jgi:tetratricopeptide (TPR) repeat protein
MLWTRLAAALLCALFVTGAAFAQDASPAASIALAELPPSARITEILPVWQDINRCSAAAFTIQLSHFIGERPYDAIIQALNPHPEDVSVRLEEMVRVANDTYGLQGVIRYAGTIDTLKRLVAAGFPVLVENVYYDGAGGFDDWLSHNRVIMGYDDALGELYTFDPLLGMGPDETGRPIPYADYDVRWQSFNYNYLVLYRPEQEAALQAALGEDWDVTTNLEHALARAEADRTSDGPLDNTFAEFNLGSTLTMLGRYEEAAAAFDVARNVGLPWRMMWYQFAPFEAYYEVGRYQDVIDLARSVIANTPGVEEVYYYAGRAYAALGDPIRAEGNYEVAILRNRYFREPVDAMAELQGVTPAPSGN